MSGARGAAIRRWLVRFGFVTIGLAPVVTVVLMGLSWLHRAIPEWVYWQAELIFLTALELAYMVAAPLSLLGTVVLGFLFLRSRRRGVSQPVLARGLMLSIALVCGLVLSEVICAGWISRSHRFSPVPDGGLGAGDRNDRSLRFAEPPAHIELRSDFPDAPGDRPIDVVVLGESSAEGVPYNRWVSIGKMVAWKLHEAIPDRPIRLNVIARAGDTLEKQHLILSNLARRPDLLIIYCGHNEFYSRLWWARNIDHYAVDKHPTSWDRIREKVERFSSLCGLMQETASRCRIAIPPPSDTGRSVVDVPNYTATEYSLLLTDFRRRLDELVTYAERVGALPVLILPPANDADFEPNRSFLPPSTTESERDAFSRELSATRRLETVDRAKARDQYQALIALQPCFAESHYRLARLLEQDADWDEAYRQYVAARDLDGMPMRCLSPFQQAYREVAAQHGCILIDGQSYFHAIGRHGLLGDELFQDAMHPSLRGQIALAQATLLALRSRRAFDWPSDSPVPVIDPAECVAQFGIGTSEWLHLALWWKGFNELMSPMRFDTTLRMQKRDAGIAAAAKINAGVAPEAVGLPNVGIPAGVPLLENRPVPAPAPAIMPCFDE
jgi:hypothetical protein